LLQQFVTLYPLSCLAIPRGASC